MNDWGNARFSRCVHYRSKTLERFLGDISTLATAFVDCGSEHIAFTTIDHHKPNVLQERLRPSGPPLEREDVRRVRFVELDDAAASRLGLRNSDLPIVEGTDAKCWHLLKVELSSGFYDGLALQIDPKEDTLLTENYLTRIWPILRQDCLSEAQNELVSAGTPQTAGWSLLDKVHIAVLVLDEKGLMYRLNRAARNVLRDEDVLRRGRGGVFAANAADSSVFSDALKKLGSEPEEQSTSQVIFLRDRGNGQRVPLTLERYYHDDKPTRFIVATLPISPSSSRVQALAKGLGLTASEAKVAALIQRGLSNRDAAALAGLKEQTFNTYAKRVLNKLDVKCRSEMARLLTWQASGGSM